VTDTIAQPVDIYAELTEPFEHTFTRAVQGTELTYITGEQAITRLNEVLGVGGWSFTVKEHGIHAEADEIWVLAVIEAAIPGDGEKLPYSRVTKQQFGSQKIKRSRQSGTPLDIGFDLKGAATDALKKCAMLLGVGLYLSAKESQTIAGQPAFAPPPAQGSGQQRPQQQPMHGEQIACEVCGDELEETRFRDGTVWSPADLAGYGRRKHGRTLCMVHYREYNNNAKAADAAREGTPF
jgi:hypothetical protein